MNCSQRAKPSPNRAQPALVTKAWSTGLTGRLISLLSVRSSNCRSQICQRGALADITCSPLNTALGAKCNHSVLLRISDRSALFADIPCRQHDVTFWDRAIPSDDWSHIIIQSVSAGLDSRSHPAWKVSEKCGASRREHVSSVSSSLRSQQNSHFGKSLSYGIRMISQKRTWTFSFSGVYNQTNRTCL